MLTLNGKKVLVVGLGRSGLAAANILTELKAEVTVTDLKGEAELADYIQKLDGKIRVEVGGHRRETFIDCDLIIVSPGVPLNSQSFLAAKAQGIKIISELELAYCLMDIPFIGVTGTNGKSTTVTLIGEILNHVGKNSIVGGNIGNPLTGEIKEIEGKKFTVAEISSFQLEGIDSFKPFISVILNITPDHLDRYDSFEDYVQAKARIFENQKENDYVVLNKDDAVVASLAPVVKAKIVWFSCRENLDYGVYLQDNNLVSSLGGKEAKIISVGEMGIKGVHNIENTLASIAIALICGVELEIIRKVIKEFKGLEHRLEFVEEIRGVKFINDSKGTNVGAVIKSLASFLNPVILIAGGRDKDSDYSILSKQIQERVKGLVLIGEAAEKIKDEVGRFAKTTKANSMQEAVEKAFSMAESGDVILLSPACSSFDMFSNYEERGRVFKEVVRELKCLKKPLLMNSF